MLDLPLLLDDVDLVALVQETGVTLRPSGRSWRARCPLHDGQNASAFVIYRAADGRQRWHCHADCGVGGDALDFVRRWEGLPDDRAGFWAAALQLANRLGRPLESYLTDGRLLPHEAIPAPRSLLDLAACHYREALHQPHGQAAVAYARRRGWNDATLRHYLGYSTGTLRAYLRQQGADLERAVECGLLRRLRDGSLVDAIPEGYLIYLHHDALGQIVYLSGRAIHTDQPDQKARNLAAPKQLFYVPPDPSNPLVIVEGQADALTVHQWGYSAVALCGSALQARDVTRLRRYGSCYLALDADATHRIRTVATQLGPLTHVVPPPPDQNDLNAWHQGGGTADDFTAHLAQAKPWIDLALAATVGAPLYELADHLDRLARLVSELPPVLQERYLVALCEEHHLTTRQAFNSLLSNHRPRPRHRFAHSEEGLVVDGQLISNFVTRVTAERVADGTRYLTLQGALDTGEALPEIELTARKFAEGAWVLTHWGARAVSYLAPDEQYLLPLAIQQVSR